MDPLTPPPFASHAVEEGGELWSWFPCSNVLCQVVRGSMSLALAHRIGESYGPDLPPGAGLRVFVDLTRLTHYTGPAREWMTAFVRENLPAIEAIHFLVSSKLISMGISAFKHVVGDERIHTYWQRESLLSSYAQAVREAETLRSRLH